MPLFLQSVLQLQLVVIRQDFVFCRGCGRGVGERRRWLLLASVVAVHPAVVVAVVVGIVGVMLMVSHAVVLAGMVVSRMLCGLFFVILKSQRIHSDTYIYHWINNTYMLS